MTANNTKYTNYLYKIPEATILFVEPKRLYIKQCESSSILVKNTSLIPDEDLQELNEHVQDDIQKDTSTHFKKPAAAEDTSKKNQRKEVKQENKNLQDASQMDVRITEIIQDFTNRARKSLTSGSEKINPNETVKTHIPKDNQKNYQNDINYYTIPESDSHRFTNINFARHEDKQTNEKQYIVVTRTDGSDQHKKLVTIHALAVDSSADLSTSYYTKLTQEIGVTADGKKVNFYFNPYYIAKSMEYCRNPNYVYWADIPKKAFDGKNYRQCVDYILRKSTFLKKDPNELLELSYSHETFNKNNYVPITMLGEGAFGYVLLVLERVENYVTTLAPYALKFQNIKPSKPVYYSLCLRGAVYEPYFYSKLEHPNILRMFKNYQLNDWRIQLFEFLPYGTLLDFIKRNTKPNIIDDWMKNNDFDRVKFLKFYSAQLLMALEYIHGLNIIHFDIKPNNVGIGYRGYLKLYDFGMSQPQKEIESKYLLQNVAEFGCKEKKDGILTTTYIGTGTDVYAFSIIFLHLFGTLNSTQYIPESFAYDEYKKARTVDDIKKLGEMWTDRILKLIEDNSDCFEKYPAVRKVFDGAFHFFDYKNRKSANQLLEMDFFKDLNKEHLFKQKYDVEAELKIDLRKLFVRVHTKHLFQRRLGMFYDNPAKWSIMKRL